MIREIGVELQAQLKIQGVPLLVVDGPEPTKTTTWGRERIVVEYDADGTDQIRPARSQHRNPEVWHEVAEACKITIYAQAVTAGALVAEHRRRAKSVRDQVVNALEVVAANRKNGVAVTGGRLVTPEDLKDTERAGGAAYELTFVWSRAIEVRTFAGAKRPEGDITGFTNTTSVRISDDGAGETACGEA